MFKRTISALSTAATLGVVGFLIWKYALNEPEDLSETLEGLGDLYEFGKEKWSEFDLGNFTNVLDGLDDLSFGDLFDEGPPQLGDNATLVWQDNFVKPTNGGLHLTLQNALDETWQGEFDVAVADWQESSALELTAQKVEVDHTCQRVDGVMVVCNANFGDTGWVGINENAVLGGVIVSSVAKMNEFYLRNADFEHRRFTMCHELGHGFGLPHTDENPYNANLGNCLDYTDDPEENLLPGEVNMAKLRNMYLSRRNLSVEKDGSVTETRTLFVKDELETVTR